MGLKWSILCERSLHEKRTEIESKARHLRRRGDRPRFIALVKVFAIEGRVETFAAHSIGLPHRYPDLVAPQHFPGSALAIDGSVSDSIIGYLAVMRGSMIG